MTNEKMSSNSTEPVAIACQNNAVPSDAQSQYIARGVWVVDFGTGYSFEKEDVPSGAGRREGSEVFNRFEEASQSGGIGALRAENTPLVAVGRFGTGGIQLLNNVGTGTKRMKALRFAEYAVLGPSDAKYDEARGIADTLGGTVVSLKSRGNKKERLEDLLDTLETTGYLRQPVR